MYCLFSGISINICLLQKKNSKWHEVLIDHDDTTSEENAFKYVLTKGETFASKALLQVVFTFLSIHTVSDIWSWSCSIQCN